MKTLHIFTSSFPFSRGEVFLETEIEYLSKCFDQITIIPYQYGVSDQARIVPPNVRFTAPLRTSDISFTKIVFKGIFNFGPVWVFLADLLKIKNLHHLKRWVRESIITRWLLTTPTVKEILAGKNNSVLYFYWSSGPTSSNLSVIVSKYLKTLVRYHGSDLYFELKTNNGYIPFREQQLKNISLAITISDHGFNYLNNRFPNQSNIKVSYLGTKSHGLNPTSKSNVLKVVSCSAMSSIKRLDIIANAIMGIEIPITWVHFGDGPLRSELESLMKNKPDHVNFEFKGHLANAEVISFYQNYPVDLFLNTSSSEGIPVSIMEAISFGIPIIATNVGGVKEIVDDSLGYLLPLQIDANDLRNQLLHFYYLSDQEKYSLRLGARKKWDQKFNADTNYLLFANIISNL